MSTSHCVHNLQYRFFQTVVPPKMTRTLVRHLHISQPCRSGHNKWSKIRHSKGVIDVERGKLFARLSNDIAVAAKAGGLDPHFNVRLAACLATAKRSDMPKANIDSALQRAAGKSRDGSSAESVMYEGTMGPFGILIETLTDNKTRTVANVKNILKKGGGAFSPCLYLFNKVGAITLRCPGGNLDDLTDTAIETGAEDIQQIDEDIFDLTSEATHLNAVATRLRDLKLEILEAELQYRPKEPAAVAGELKVSLIDMLQRLESDEDVTRVTSNVKMEDEDE